MEHAAHALVAANGVQARAVRLAVVDDDRQIQLDRQRQLTVKESLLTRAVHRLPMAIQPDFPDRNNLVAPPRRRIGEPRPQAGQLLLRLQRLLPLVPARRAGVDLAVLRVNADRRRHERAARRLRDRLPAVLQVGAMLITARTDARNAGSFRTPCAPPGRASNFRSK